MDLREAHQSGETRHPWEVARFNFFNEILQATPALRQPVSVLDVGSGDAWFANQLAARLPTGSHITCWDSGYSEASSDPNITRTMSRPEMHADVILLLDVLEHVETDRDFLSTLVLENTHPGSLVLVSVPAWQLLFTTHDTFLKHHRRYSPREGRTLLTTSGLRIIAEGGLFHSLLAPRALSKTIELAYRTLGRDIHPASEAAWRGGSFLSQLVSTTLAIDNRASHFFSRLGVNAPGLSWWAICATA